MWRNSPRLCRSACNVPAALALAIAGCLLIQPGVDQVIDALPLSKDPRIAAPVEVAVSIGDLACIILTRNPKNAFELAQHATAAGVALYQLGVRLDGVAAVRNPYRGSDPWMDDRYAPPKNFSEQRAANSRRANRGVVHSSNALDRIHIERMGH